MKETDLKTVIDQARSGDGSALAELYERFHASVLNLALRIVRNREDAEDVCQEAWLLVQRDIPKLRSSAAFSVWLRKVAATTAFKRVRACRREWGPGDLAAAAFPGKSAFDPEERLEYSEEVSLAWDALAMLSPRQRAALYLREVEEYDYRQIAAAIETSVSAVETLLFRARRSLAKTYNNLTESPGARCRRAQDAMAAVLDGEGGPVERLALRAHARVCGSCSSNLLQLRDSARVHAAIPLLPLTAPALQAYGSGGAGILGMPKLSLFFAKAKALATPALVATSLAVTSIAVPATQGIRSDVGEPVRTQAHAVPGSPVTGQSGQDPRLPISQQSVSFQPATPAWDDASQDLATDGFVTGTLATPVGSLETTVDDAVTLVQELAGEATKDLPPAADSHLLAGASEPVSTATGSLPEIMGASPDELPVEAQPDQEPGAQLASAASLP